MHNAIRAGDLDALLQRTKPEPEPLEGGLQPSCVMLSKGEKAKIGMGCAISFLENDSEKATLLIEFPNGRRRETAWLGKSKVCRFRDGERELRVMITARMLLGFPGRGEDRMVVNVEVGGGTDVA